MMSGKLSKNSKVTWQWLGRPIHGVVKEVYDHKVTRNIKGSNITRNGTKENPAYLVESDAGNLALKLGTELQKTASSPRTTRVKPKIFSEE